mgnify:CR=1 FL=1
MDAVTEAFVKLKKSINWMRMLKFTTKAALPVASAVISGGASIIPTLISVFQENKEHLTDILTGDKAEEFLQNAINRKTTKRNIKQSESFVQTLKH